MIRCINCGKEIAAGSMTPNIFGGWVCEDCALATSDDYKEFREIIERYINCDKHKENQI